MEYKDTAYSVAKVNNKWAVVALKYDAKSLKTEGTVTVVESNTDKIIVQERLNIILNKEEIL